VIDNFSLPSRHPAAVREELLRRAMEAIRAFGLRDGFWNVELWCRPDGPVLTEVNCRSAASFAGLYEGCLGASIFAAVVELACGREPERLPGPNGRVGGQFNVVTFAEDRVENLVDLAALPAAPAFCLFRDPDEVVRPVSEFGTVLGQIELFGESYEEIRAEAERLRRRLLRRPEASPW
jgi:hypothetical protein